MPKTLTVDVDTFKQGLQVLEDDSMAPIGSARKMTNVLISDRGGIKPRPGTSILGVRNTGGNPIKGFKVFKKSFGSLEIPIKTYDDEMEAYDTTLADWYRVKDGFTVSKQFGFFTSLVNAENEDYIYFCNRFEPYQRWQGSVTNLNGALSGGETDITVDSTVRADILHSATASASAATTLDIATADWVSSQWINFYVHITSGVHSGKVRRITSNTPTRITFNDLGSDPGLATFEIKQLAFPNSNITAATIAFVDSNPDTITDSGSGFVKAGFIAGDKIVVSGSGSNDGTYTIASVAAGTITLESTDALSAEGTGATVTIALESMTLIYNGTTIAYTGIDTSTTFQVSSAHSASNNAPVAIVPTEYPGNPRGNRMDTLLGRAMVGNVRSALSRDSGGNLQGSATGNAVFVSKLLDPRSFDFSATRVAGEGDLISMPYGGGDITDITVQEDLAFVYKKSYIESMKYSQDANDAVIRTPLKSGIGSVGKVIRGKNDHYFMTLDKQFTSIGRVLGKDLKVQTENIGLPIKRLLDTYDFTDFVGVEYRNRILFSCKKASTDTNNNITLLFNRTTETFEGSWNIGASGFDIYNNDLYYAEADGSNVHKMFTGIADVAGDDTFPITATWQSNFFNLLPLKGNIQSISSIAIEGYIKTGSTVSVKLYKDFSDEASLSFDLTGTEDSLLLGMVNQSFLGSTPIALEPLGTVEDPDADGLRRFSFIVYFPYIYGQYFSTEFSSSGKVHDWEILRTTLGLTEDVSVKKPRIKTL